MSEYYARALADHGPTAGGVDWSSPESQQRRFEVLLYGIDWSGSPTLLDYGCGYGALAGYLDARGLDCRYLGYDLAPSMIETARALIPSRPDRRFTTSPTELTRAHYVIASGVLNVKLDASVEQFTRYVERTLIAMFKLTGKRLSFNMLPPPSSPELSRPDLYYADPQTITGFCERRLGGQVKLIRDYGLWEFTIAVSRAPRP